MNTLFRNTLIAFLVSASTAYSQTAQRDTASLKKFLNNRLSYGISEQNPILLGSRAGRSGPKVLSNYMDRLRGFKGEKVTYHRVGTCCEFKTPRGLFDGTGVLEVWEATYEGLGKKVKLFINVYDYGDVSAPLGFSLKK